MDTKEKRKMIYGLIEDFAEKLSCEDQVYESIWAWDVTIAEMAFVFEYALRRSVPVPSNEAAARVVAGTPQREIRL